LEYGQRGLEDVLVTFIRTKFSPLASIPSDWLFGENVIGEEIDYSSGWYWLELPAPLAISDIVEAMIESGAAVGTAEGMGAIMGVGLQIYPPYTSDPGSKASQTRKQAQEDYPDAYSDKELIEDKYDSLTTSEKNALPEPEGYDKEGWADVGYNTKVTLSKKADLDNWETAYPEAATAENLSNSYSSVQNIVQNYLDEDVERDASKDDETIAEFAELDVKYKALPKTGTGAVKNRDAWLIKHEDYMNVVYYSRAKKL